MNGETIAALATAPGPAGIAVVRVSGPDAFTIAAALTGHPLPPETAPQNLGNLGTGPGNLGTKNLGTGPKNLGTGPKISNCWPFVRFAKFRFPPACGRARPAGTLDEGLLLAFKGPRSYTGEDVVEFQCHGGAVSPRRVLAACFAAGARPARRGEFTERAFLNGKMDLAAAESVLDLVSARTDRAADAALAGVAGARSARYRAFYDAALALSSDLEHALDIDEGELPERFLSDVSARRAHLANDLDAALARANEGRILREGARVVLAGPPNAGKSSLMNALLGEDRVLVSSEPGTTRDAIEEALDLDGWLVRLTDTAGLRSDGAGAIEAAGIARAERLIAEADLILALGPLSESHAPPAKVLLLHPKCDLGRGDGLNVSSKTGEGLDALRRAIVARLEALAGGDSEAAALAPSVRECAGLAEARRLLTPSDDLVLMANGVRAAAEALGRIVGAVYADDLLDALFSRFCVGK